MMQIVNEHWVMPDASATSSADDFDFLVGKWNVKNKKLRKRLCQCDEWDFFASEIHLEKVLLGNGNVERYLMPDAEMAFEGLALRLFNPGSKLWTIHWIDTVNLDMDHYPVTGSFEDGIGRFYAKMPFEGNECIVLYQWDARDRLRPVWSQAFSADRGLHWEWNWFMYLERKE